MVLKSKTMDDDVVHSHNELAGEASIDILIPSYMIDLFVSSSKSKLLIAK